MQEYPFLSFFFFCSLLQVTSKEKRECAKQDYVQRTEKYTGLDPHMISVSGTKHDI